MGLQDAVRVVLTTKYLSFSGRARRSEFWWFYLFTIMVGLVAGVFDGILGTGVLFSAVVSLALFLPSLGATIRRLHDTGRSGWWLLIGFVPLIGFIVVIVFLVQDSASGTNKFGPNPKYAAAPGQ